MSALRTGVNSVIEDIILLIRLGQKWPCIIYLGQVPEAGGISLNQNQIRIGILVNSGV
jgi:hypothetical protein